MLPTLWPTTMYNSSFRECAVIFQPPQATGISVGAHTCKENTHASTQRELKGQVQGQASHVTIGKELP